MTQAPFQLRGAREGWSFGKAPAGRGLALERADRQLLQHAHGGDGREPRAEVRHHAPAVRRVRARRASSAGPRRTRRAASRARSRPSSCRRRRAPVTFAVDEHPRPQSTLEALAKLAPVFKKDGVVTAGQRVGHLRRRRGARAHERGLREEEGPQAARAPRAVGRRGRRPEHHGHRSRAGHPQRARAGGAQAVGHRSRSRSTRRSRRSTSPSRRSSASTAPRRTSTAARSRSATRSARAARASRRTSSTSSRVATAATRSAARASAAVRASRS